MSKDRLAPSFVVSRLDRQPGLASSHRPKSLRLSGIQRLFCSPLFIVSVALGLRLATILHEHTYRIPAPRTWQFAYEAGQIAGSLASHHGFALYWPFLLPTAQVAPMYPLLMAGVFKLFGLWTNTSAFVMLALDAVFSAATCFMLFLIAKQIFSDGVAIGAAWAWALLPQSVYWSTHFIWYTTLSTLLLTCVFLLTLRAQGAAEGWKWFGLGLLWALIFLTNPSLASFMPVAFLWLAYPLRHRPGAAAALLAVAALAFLLGISPWVIRNYRVFGTPIFSRTDLGEELWAGNHEGGNGLYWAVKPWDQAKLRRMGEIAFMRERRDNALRFIRQHPDQFAIFTLRRIGYFWCDTPQRRGRGNPDYIPFSPRLDPDLNARHAIYFGFSFLAFWGLWTAWRRGVRGAALFAGLFLFYPLIYYITHCHPRYEFPIVPEMMLLVVYLLHDSFGQPSTFVSWFRGVKQSL